MVAFSDKFYWHTIARVHNHECNHKPWQRQDKVQPSSLVIPDVRRDLSHTEHNCILGINKYVKRLKMEQWKERIKRIQKENKELFNKLKREYNKIKGVRVGDYVKEKNGNYTRVTYIWPDGQVQTGGHKYGQFFLGKGYISYSGSLDHGYNIKDLKLTKEKRSGMVWIWREGMPGANRGVEYMMKFRVFKVK